MYRVHAHLPYPSLPFTLPPTPPPSHSSSLTLFLPTSLHLCPTAPHSLHHSLSPSLSLLSYSPPSSPLFLPCLPPLLGNDSSHFSQSSQMSGLKDLSLSPSLRAHGYLTLGENAQEEVRGGREEGRRVGERIER